MKHPHYVLDADVLMTANRNYYAPDICPSFWQRLIQAHQEGHLVSIDRVRDEILNGNDSLVKWAKEEATDIFAPSTELIVADIFSRISDWVQQNNQFTDAAKEEFLGAADGWLAAYARANNATVVTLETFDANIRRRVKLPNVCRRFGVEYINTFEMLRRIGASF